ncbi:MAG: non-ribosomal peptide synthetase, partial [Gammaproteobacteria bacterium]
SRWLKHELLSQIRIYNMYGITEGVIHSTIMLVDIEYLKINKNIIGMPLEDVEIMIVDNDLQPVRQGMIGEILLGGRLAKGYMNNSIKNKQKFIEHHFVKFNSTLWLKTGDLARYAHDGLIEYKNRLDRQLKLRGHRIEPAHIESCLLNFESINQVYVILKKGYHSNNKLVAYIVSNEKYKQKEEELLLNLKKRLPSYMIPSEIIFLPSLPLTLNGKIAESLLPNNSLPNIQLSNDLSLTSKLLKIWIELLDNKNIKIDDNFFDCGGNSLLLHSLQMKIHEVFNINIKIIDIFQYPTIRSMINYLNTNEKTEAFPHVTKNLSKKPNFYRRKKTAINMEDKND